MDKQNARVPRLVIILALGTFVVVLDTTFVNVSITALVKDLNTTVDKIQGATALSTLLMAVFVLMGGKMGAVLGMKRSFLLGVLLTIAGGFVASVANNLEVFVLGWCLIQGLGLPCRNVGGLEQAGLWREQSADHPA